MKIIGIDPGSRITGYGIIDKNGSEIRFITCGVVKSSPQLAFPERLKELHDGLAQVIEKFGPRYASVEDIFFARNPSSALKLGQARGALIIAALGHGLIVKEFSAKQVKQTVAGYGQASKAQIQHMVRILLNLTSSPSEDAADALANALCLATHLDTY
jgi:crossover junction endodeoxyribonuclease RuvC